MASVSASHLIIFIASLVIAAGVVGTLTTGVDRLNTAIDDRSLDVTQQVRMDMTILNDPVADNTDGNDVVIYVRNTGSQGVPIEASAVDIVFNGQFIGNDEITIRDANTDEPEGVWQPGDVIEISIPDDNLNTDSDNRLLLTVNEDEEEFEFRG